MSKQLILLLGGARSGKSRYAVEWASTHGRDVLFIATAQEEDDEMRSRIARHRAERPAHWSTLETPLRAAEAIGQHDHPFDTVIVDCLTLLASNVLMALPQDCSPEDYDSALAAEIELLLRVYERSTATWLIVSNEVGMGLVPPYPLGRLFRDGLGRANQRLAGAADQVLLMVAGLPWTLKP